MVMIENPYSSKMWSVSKQTCFPLFQEINWFPEAVITKSPCDDKHDISPDLSNPAYYNNTFI